MQPLRSPLIITEKNSPFFSNGRNKFKRELCAYMLFLMISILWPD